MNPSSSDAGDEIRIPLATNPAQPPDLLSAIEGSSRFITETLPHLVWSARSDGFTDYYNGRFLQYLGRSLEEMQGWTWIETLHPEDVASARHAWENAQLTGKDYEATFRIRNGRSGGYQWHIARAAALRDPLGKVIRWWGTCSNIHERKLAQEALEESNSRFRATLSDAPVGVGEASLDGQLTFVNRAFCELLGYTERELLQKRWQDITHPDDLGGDEQLAKQVAANEIPHYTLEKRYLRKDGTAVWANVFGTFMRNSAGEPVRGIGVVVDISARRLAEQRLSAVLSSIDDHLICYDRAWRFTYVNDGAARTLGKPPAELIGKCVWDLFPAAVGNQFYKDVHRALEEQCIVHAEHYYTPWDKWFENFIYPSQDGVTVFGTEVTERTRARHALRDSEELYRTLVESQVEMVCRFRLDGTIIFANHAYATVFGTTADALRNQDWWSFLPRDDRLQVRARLGSLSRDNPEVRLENHLETAQGPRWYMWTFRALRFDPRGRASEAQTTGIDITERKHAEDALLEADRRKNEFIATLSHELRNPIAPVRNALSLLQLSAAEGRSGRLIGKETKPILDIMERQISQLVRLVDDLLEMSRISTGRLTLRKERLELSALVRSGIETSQPLIHAAGHELEVQIPEEPVWIDGDSVRLTQILANLLNNAAIYTENGGRITVIADYAERWASITVSDNGMGIPADQLTHIFEMFRRGPLTSTKGSSGLGIGLTIARHLAQMHGGSLEARSEGPGRGSQFVMRFPAYTQTVTPGLAEVAQVAPLSPHRILVADDNQDAAETLSMILGFLGADVRVAANGQQALEEFRAHDPRIVFLDIGMPDMDGYEVAQAIRRDYSDRRPVLVALTGWGQEQDRRSAQAAGFDHHMVKPADIAALRTLLSSLT